MKIAPSVLTADFTNLKEELQTIQNADYIHVDIMDGHFVPNISFGPAITKQISNHTKLPLDIHLMVTDPLQWIEAFALSKPEFITIHIEANDVIETIKKIKSHGIKVGLSIKPKTPIQDIMSLLNQIDLVLVMSVEPGFGGQSFMKETISKMKALHELKKDYHYVIEVDGGVNQETIESIRPYVDISVVGSYLFNQKDRANVIKALQ